MNIIPDPVLNSKKTKAAVQLLVMERSHFLPLLSVGADNDSNHQQVSSLSLAFGHYIYNLGPGDIKKFPALPRKDKFRFILMKETGSVAGTVDFESEKGKIRFSHFTSGPPVDLFVSYLLHIENHPDYRNLDVTLEFIKIPSLSLNAVKLTSGTKSLYIKFPSKISDGVLEVIDEKTFGKSLSALINKGK
jgi:hypothetical protein